MGDGEEIKQFCEMMVKYGQEEDEKRQKETEEFHEITEKEERLLGEKK